MFQGGGDGSMYGNHAHGGHAGHAGHAGHGGHAGHSGHGGHPGGHGMYAGGHMMPPQSTGADSGYTLQTLGASPMGANGSGTPGVAPGAPGAPAGVGGGDLFIFILIIHCVRSFIDLMIHFYSFLLIIWWISLFF